MDKEYIDTYICLYIDTYFYISIYLYLSIYLSIYLHRIEYHSMIQKNEILPFATTWMQLECVMVSKLSQSEKDKYHMISLMCGI